MFNRIKYLALTIWSRYDKPMLQLLQLVFFRFVVVVTSGFGVFFPLITYAGTFKKNNKSRAMCLWRFPQNVKA